LLLISFEHLLNAACSAAFSLRCCRRPNVALETKIAVPESNIRACAAPFLLNAVFPADFDRSAAGRTWRKNSGAEENEELEIRQ